MSDFETFSFVIPAYSPQTMPLDRLIEYLQQIATIIGDAENLHLVGIEKSSTAPTFLVPKRVALEARERTAKLERGEGTREQTRAYNRIRKMLRHDARDAGRPAVLSAPGRVLLKIDAAPEDSGIITGVRQATTVDGALIRIGGAGDYASLQMQDLQGAIMSGFTASKHLAKEMAKLIYEPIRVSGIGLWSRSQDGIWCLDRMQVQSYETLEDETLEMVIERLRDLKVAWPKDALKKLQAERGVGV